MTAATAAAAAAAVVDDDVVGFSPGTHTHTCNIQYVGLCIYLQFFFNRNRTNILRFRLIEDVF